MKKIIEHGKLFLAMPPLYKITYKNSNLYAYDEKEKNKIINSSSEAIINIARFKGLGEMPAGQLKETTMDIDKRKLIKIDLSKGNKEEKKTEKLFESLMGKKAESRYKFIQENANFSNILDI